MAIPCELVDQQARPTLVVRTRAAVERLPEVLGPAWGSILACAGRAGAEPASRPFVAYHNMDMQDLDLEIGFAFDRPLEGEGEVRASEIPAGKAVETVHVGPYDEIGSAYEAVQAWMSVQGLLPAGPSYEYYLNDPAEVAPEELRTRIVVPVG